MNIILSIKPKYAEAILNGSKRYEFRKSIFRTADIDKVYIYATQPVKKIVGFFRLGEIVYDDTKQLWARFQTSSSLDNEGFTKYFDGHKKGYAIETKNAERFKEPVDPKGHIKNFVAPQSFRYIDTEIQVENNKSNYSKVTEPKEINTQSPIIQQGVSNSTEQISVKEASRWASEHFGRNISPSNISYLIQYGRISKTNSNGGTLVDKKELLKYYQFSSSRESEWKKKLGDDLNWSLSFDNLKESERTKHVHRLHPYKGKFIPQLVEYFLDSHIDQFKKEFYFRPGDVLLDPFSGSGTTLVQANELGMHAIGVDISFFNSLISNIKVAKYDLGALSTEISMITRELKSFVSESGISYFENKLDESLADFNKQFFPSPAYKVAVLNGDIDEWMYGPAKAMEFEPTYKRLVTEYNINLEEYTKKTFLDKWYFKCVRKEIDLVRVLISRITDDEIRNVLTIVLSRTIRSCRATTHFDLATLKDPVSSAYYCHKHGKICRPIFSIAYWWDRYSKDTVNRLAEFSKLRTNTYQICLTGDSRNLDIKDLLRMQSPELARLVERQGIRGIFSSPPYIGLIDYHDQHAYAYDLFDFERHDDMEIGKLSYGQGTKARDMYVKSIAESLRNCRKFLVADFDIFLVANDKYGLYMDIAEQSGMRIVNQYKRPVLARTERDKGAYSEIIFHIKTK